MDHKLCVLFWFLLLQNLAPSMCSPILTHGCRPGTMKECKDTKFVPGHTLLGDGIDIVTLKTTGNFLFDLQEVENKCTVCENPHKNFILQKLPKAVVDWRPETSCSRNIQSSVSQSKVSVANEATSVVQNDWKVGLNVKVQVSASTALGGSQSKMAKFAESRSLVDKYNFLSHKLQCSFYSFSLGSNASFTPHFQKSLDELPDFYNASNKGEYRRLIAKFGTHYITHVKVGGLAQEVTAVKTCQVAMNGLKIDEVKDCLSIEAEIEASKMGKSASIDSKVEHCKNKLAKLGLGSNFHQKFKEHSEEVIGGNASFDLLSNKKNTDDVYKRWIESLKTNPGLVSYSLDSIHNLVKNKGPKKESLRLAISDYINEMALTQKCSCPGRHQGKDCSCTCPASKYTSSNCCPTHKGAAKLHVTIISATGLKGDFWSETDAYVKFKFDGNDIRTPTIMNKNNPTWNINFNLGVVRLGEDKMYTVEVWDEDNRSDDFLGRCEKVLNSGENSDTCYLKRGSVSYSVKVTCVSHLDGSLCQDYISVPSA
ncbi:perforin-1-like [Ranitomeya variabilis]|uniref:perforin-1-like n=1 Tax=Ranitomeya variabilis TaxID=490064 RepID=UPI00405734DF